MLIMYLITFFIIDILLTFFVLKYFRSCHYDTPVEEKHDCLVVFYNGYKRINSETAYRLDFAAFLYKARIASAIICVGGNRKRSGYSGARDMVSYLIKHHGIPGTHIFFETVSFDSLTNIQNAEIIINKHEWKKIIFISNWVHLKRLFFMAKNKDYIVKPVSYPYGKQGLLSLFFDWKVVHGEFFAWIGYLIRISPIWRKLY